MKNIYRFILIVAAAMVVFTGCKKIIEKVPDTSISDQVALTTVEGLQAALVGTYNSLQNGDLYGGSIWTCGDMLANNVINSGQGNLVFEETQMIEKNMSPDNRLSGSLWQNAYYAINMANSVLEAVPEVDPAPAVADQIRGECLFIRAMLYFDLIRYFGNPNTGLGVPLLTTPSGIDAKPSRAPMEDVYAQIIADLTEAASLLPESNSNRATSWAAKALLSRVYFYHGDEQACIDISTEIIGSLKFSLVDSVLDNFGTKVTPEIIFAIMSTTVNPSAGALGGYFRYASNGKFSPSSDVIKVFTFTGGLQDQRYRNGFVIKDGKYFTTLYDDKYMNVPIIRFAEIYLNRAEMRYNRGNTQGALDDMNMVRRRALLPDETVVNPSKLYYERMKELIFQGDNFFNQKRLKKASISNKKLPWNSVRFMYLIPQREIDVNPNLVQNTE